MPEGRGDNRYFFIGLLWGLNICKVLEQRLARTCPLNSTQQGRAGFGEDHHELKAEGPGAEARSQAVWPQSGK